MKPLILLLFLTTAGLSQEIPTDSIKAITPTKQDTIRKCTPIVVLKTAGGIVIVGGLVTGLAWMAKEYPRYTGAIFAVMPIPILGDPQYKSGEAAKYVVAGGFFVLGLYNILDADGGVAARKRRFIITAAGFIVIPITGAVIEKMYPDKKKEGDIGCGIGIGPNTALLTFTKKF